MDKKNNTVTPTGAIPTSIMTKVKIPRKFEIFVEEWDEEGGAGHQGAWKPVKIDPTLGGNGSNPVITVSSQQDMLEKQNFYKQLGQRFKILREIDPPTQDMILQAAKEQGLDVPDTIEQPKPAPVSDVQRTPPAAVERPQTTLVSKQKPKIVTIGDVQIKYDGDKVYQKQWVKLTAGEQDNIRVVSDATNKIVNLAGKHIEAKKWILVEEDSDDADDAFQQG